MFIFSYETMFYDDYYTDDLGFIPGLSFFKKWQKWTQTFITVQNVILAGYVQLNKLYNSQNLKLESMSPQKM